MSDPQERHRSRFQPRLAWLVAGVLLGALAVAWQWPSAGREGEAVPRGAAAVSATQARARTNGSALQAELEALRARLADEVAARESLERRVDRLMVLAGREPVPPEEVLADAPDAGESREEGLDPDAGGGQSAPGRPVFDDDALLQAGLDPLDAELLRERWADWEMEKLYLQDEATRDGWRRGPRYRRELARLETELQADLGEEGYEWLRFATGEPNRVVVRDVLDRTPASGAGLRAGDRIVSYDGIRIYLPRELKRQTTGGEVGEYVRVFVERGSEEFAVSVPRGPLGVILQAESAPPTRN